MPTVGENLKRILEAVRGIDVRQSIHDAIKQCYDDATGNPASIAAYANKVDELQSKVTELENTIAELKSAMNI